MKNGEFPDGARTLRSRIDMASPNIWMRDPIISSVSWQPVLEGIAAAAGLAVVAVALSVVALRGRLREP